MECFSWAHRYMSHTKNTFTACQRPVSETEDSTAWMFSHNVFRARNIMIHFMLPHAPHQVKIAWDTDLLNAEAIISWLLLSSKALSEQCTESSATAKKHTFWHNQSCINSNHRQLKTDVYNMSHGNESVSKLHFIC